MALLKLSPVLYTEDVEGTMAFYTGVLGFRMISREENFEWVMLNLDQAWLMISRPNEHRPFNGPQFTGSFYFNTDGVDQLWERLRDQVSICYPIEDFYYGMREFAVYDNNGYILQFGQELEDEA